MWKLSGSKFRVVFEIKFQKNLIVWKLSKQIKENITDWYVSEELNSVETAVFND